jgi:hypothetical protein
MDRYGVSDLNSSNLRLLESSALDHHPRTLNSFVKEQSRYRNVYAAAGREAMATWNGDFTENASQTHDNTIPPWSPSSVLKPRNSRHGIGRLAEAGIIDEPTCEAHDTSPLAKLWRSSDRPKSEPPTDPNTSSDSPMTRRPEKVEFSLGSRTTRQRHTCGRQNSKTDPEHIAR